MKKLLSGNEAFARGAWEAGVNVVSGYPGTPSTEVLENISKHYKDDLYCEWAPNEKVAFEMAAGASLAGARSMVTMKHVGLNVAADPLMTFTYIGTVGGFIALVADDPGMNSSQNEQDTRLFARFAKIPVFEPSDSAEAVEFVKYAYDISEKYATPTIMRSTTTVSHSRGIVELSDRLATGRKIEFKKDPSRFIPVPAFARQMHLKVEDRYQKIQEEASNSPLNRIEMRDSTLGIITSGAAYQYVREVFPEVSVLKLGWSYPYPDDLLLKFAENVDHVLVVEELEDFIEEHIKAIGIDCIGKKYNGENLVPRFYELNVDILLKIRAKLPKEFFRTSTNSVPVPSKFHEVSQSFPALPPRPAVLCPGCPHRGVFYTLGKFDVVVTGDIGCYTLGMAPPLSRLDALICMGGGITLAHGMHAAGSEQKIVGIVGDSTFFHSGITGLMDIVYNKGASVIIVLDNRTTGMTGHQDNPGTGKTITGEETNAISIAEVGKVLGVPNIAEVNARDIKELTDVIGKALDSKETWLIVAKTPCLLAERKMPGKPLSIDPVKCKKCGSCLKLGCPAIEKGPNGMRINTLLCAGCKLCEQVCPFKAFIDPEITGDANEQKNNSKANGGN